MQSGAYIAVERVIIWFSGGPKRIFASVFTASDIERTKKDLKDTHSLQD